MKENCMDRGFGSVSQSAFLDYAVLLCIAFINLDKLGARSSRCTNHHRSADFAQI